MKKSVILHIGLHKSGTSSLQRFLTVNCDALAEAGLLYPRVSRTRDLPGGGPNAHHALATQLNPKTGNDEDLLHRLKREFDAEAEHYDRILISSESFPNIRDMSRVAWFFDGYDVRTLCYAREIGDYAVAAYQQSVQNTNQSASIEYFLQNFRGNLPLVYRTWTDFTPNTTWKFFSPPILKNNDIVADALDEIGLKDFVGKKVPSQNPSIAGNLLTFKLMHNLFYPHRGEVYAALEKLALAEPRFRGKIQVPDSALELIRKREAQGYNKIVNRIAGGDVPMPTFSHAPPRFDPDRWAEDLETITEHKTFRPLRDQPPFASAFRRA